jgi:hypothetical protein
MADDKHTPNDRAAYFRAYRLANKEKLNAWHRAKRAANLEDRREEWGK